MDKYIQLINKLQEVQTTAQLKNSPIQLPQIVVVGSQSSGKSSVLESFVGYPFLPRGAGIVTRRPLILQLVQTFPETDRPREAKNSEFWAKFNHKKQYMTDYDDVLNEIQYETDKVAGENKGISSEPILLTVYSDKVVNLTVVDLPGITKVPVGDQPEDIEHQIRELIMEYITNENSIILAVSAANTDMATSEAVKMAKEVDPFGERTLAVITKLDLMDRGTDATDCLEGRVIPVKLGIIGVVNRSQQDINDNKSIEDAIRDEKNFLEEKYPTSAQKNGTNHLATTLNNLLVKHIEKCIPDLKKTISEQINSNTQILLALGEVIDLDLTTIRILKKFNNKYCNDITGSSKDVNTSKLNGGARIASVFRENFANAIGKVTPLENLDDNGMNTVMRNAAGMTNRFNVPQSAFESLVRRQLNMLERPSLNCVESVYKEMRKIIATCEEELKTELSRFPNFIKRIREVVEELLEERLKSTQEKVRYLIDMEKAYVDISHPEFRNTVDRIVNHKMCSSNQKNFSNMTHEKLFGEVMTSIISTDMIPRDTEKRQDLNQLIDSYFCIIRRDIKDKVPKAVVLTLINYVVDNLYETLMKTFYKTVDAAKLLAENPNIIAKRENLMKQLKTLQDFSDSLDDFEAGPSNGHSSS